MNLQELRIGNYVLADGMILLQVDAVGIKPFPHITAADQNWNIEFMKPVPLDEEWLLKFWFKDKDYEFTLKAKTRTIAANWYSRIIATGIRNGYYVRGYKHIKYVHQLQNLYHALTGNELNTTTI